MVNPECLKECPFVVECLATAERYCTELDEARQSHSDLSFTIIENNTTRDLINELPLKIEYEEWVNEFGSKDEKKAWEKTKAREEKSFNKLQRANEKAERDSAEGERLLSQIIDTQQQRADAALSTCEGGPEAAKRWRFFGHEVIRCTSPVGNNYTYRFED